MIDTDARSADDADDRDAPETDFDSPPPDELFTTEPFDVGEFDDDEAPDSLTESPDETDDGLDTTETEAEVDAALAALAAELPSGAAEASDVRTAPLPPSDSSGGPAAPHLFGFRRAAARVREFPNGPGVYLFKDSAGRVIYVGKAKHLRSRAGSYFSRTAELESRTGPWIHEICDADYLECESEVDAMLAESRLIKDIQPKFNKDLKDGKTFPYLQITTYEDYPRVEVTRTPRDRGVKLYGPFPSAGSLRGAVQVLQRIFRFRTCSLDIDASDERWRWFRPCLLASIRQCTAPCDLRISKEDYRADIRRLQMVLEGRKGALLTQLQDEMRRAAAERKFEQAAKLRDEIKAIESLDRRGNIETHVQPEVFPIDPRKGLAGLRKVLKLASTPRTIEGVDIAHLGGTETVASLVKFFDGLPFKAGYRRYRIQGVEGIDDFRSIHEVVARRFRHLETSGEPFPDLLLIDGGKGQLNAAMAAFRELQIEPPTVLSLAKRDEEIFLPGESEPIRLGRHSFALRLLQYVRDEAHRFAQHYHHLLRHKSQLDR